jgi:hypothetical protein
MATPALGTPRPERCGPVTQDFRFGFLATIDYTSTSTFSDLFFGSDPKM